MLAAAASGMTPSGFSVLATIVAALLLYAGGLLANDFFDRMIDAQERPARPIPSGAVSAKSVLLWASLLTGAGLLAATQAGQAPALIAVLIAAVSWFYNVTGKHLPRVAPITMGLCRGLSVLMGASILGTPGLTSASVLSAMALLTSYITLITIAARGEASASGDCHPPTWVTWGLPLLVLAGLFIPAAIRGQGELPSLSFEGSGFTFGLAGMAVIWVVLWSVHLYRASLPRQIQQAIGGLIRALLLIQATLCASAGSSGEGLALLLLLVFPLSGWLAKWFYGS